MNDTKMTLPELCFAVHPTDRTLIIIKREQDGYFPADPAKWPRHDGDTVEAQARRANDRMGVTTAQRMAMEMGSIAGWNVPGAKVVPHLGRALVEDLNTVDKTLGDEAHKMLKNGATYEEVRDRFKAIVIAAEPLREGAN